MPKGGRRPGAGRKKGVPNRITTSMREAWREAFDLMGGVPALVKWGTENESDFYKCITRLIPQDITSGGQPLTGLISSAERDARIVALLARVADRD